MSEMTAEISGTFQAKAKLYGALARLQADLPKIPKNKIADTGTYKYKYADLPSIAEAVLPQLGKLGLAFVAFPTLNTEGRFVLAYSLVHEAGAEMTGEYLLPDKGSPQQVGSAITYARRYALCAVTGIAADEDDDGAAAQQTYQYSAARERPQGQNRQQRAPQGQVSRPAAERPQPPADENGEPVADDAAQEFADQAQQARALRDLEDINRRAREAGKLTAFVRNPAGGGLGKLAVYIDWRRKQLADVDKALKELDEAARSARLDYADMEEHVKLTTGVSLEGATPAQIRQAAQALRDKAAA